MQSTIDSLRKELAAAYKPGFGEMMSGIQAHHAKLWFAGLYQNWELAGFEMHEIQEGLENIEHYCSDRPETRSLSMLNAALDSMNNSIAKTNIELFKKSYILLTTGCNNCHKETAHAFNVVTIPVAPPVTNQDFKPHLKQ